MKIVFLDIDGVINDFGGGPTFDKAMVGRLNEITDASGAKIVIHSSWRYAYSLEQLQKRLAGAGVTGEIIDVAPSPVHSRKLSGIYVPEVSYETFCEGTGETDERAVAIRRWMMENGTPEAFVILDDMRALGTFMDTPHFINTVTERGGRWAHNGLTDKHVVQALGVLGVA